MRLRLLIVTTLLVVGGLAATRWLRPAEPSRVRAALIAPADAPPDATGFARATDPQGMRFPDAFGAHPAYQTEWWYYTGNLQTAEGREFGYQFTIFRRSLVAEMPPRDSDLAPQSIYMAHFAVTDAAGGAFYPNERFARGAGGLAGAQAVPYEVWLDDWRVVEAEAGRYRMEAEGDEVAIAFTLESLKPTARHGNNGLSQKSAEPGNATYYYSQTRLATEGTITVRGQPFAVRGLSWKDHEYGTSALAANAVGWDWFSLQLSDGREVMFFQIRTESGALEAASSGSLVLADGSVRPLGLDDVQIEVLAQWSSPHSGGEYPARWRLTVPSEGIELTLTPLLADQELNVSTTYWEGAVRAEGSANGQPLSARGYVELTGYGGSRAPSVSCCRLRAV